MQRSLALIFVLFILGMAHCKEAKRTSLRSVQVILRHGDREPDDNIEHPKGRLTDLGKKQMYEVGLFLKERYENLLPGKTLAKVTSLFSSDNDRTINSAQLVGLGLSNESYEKGDSLRKEHILTPIPVRTIPKAKDQFIQINRKDCPKFQKLLADSIFILAENYFETNLNYFMKYAQATGDWNILNKTLLPENIDSFTFYQERAFYNKSIGLRLDAIAEEAVMNPQLIYKPSWQALTVNTPEKQRFYVGPFFRLFVQQFEAVGAKTVKIYSGHDRNLFGFMLTLKIWQEANAVPPVGATLLSELHEAPSGQTFLEFWYKNDTGTHFLQVPKCGNLCTLPQFINNFQHLIPEETEAECQL